MNIQKVMVIDDDLVSQMVAEAIISKFNSSIEIVTANDGQEALNTLETSETKPDVILLDLNMPGMNGLEFLEAYQHNKKENSIVAIHTSSENDTDKQKTSAYNFVKAYFTKPITMDDIAKLQHL